MTDRLFACSIALFLFACASTPARLAGWLPGHPHNWLLIVSVSLLLLSLVFDHLR